MKSSRSSKSLTQTARDCVARHDYEQAIYLLESIPVAQRSAPILRLLAASQKRQQKVDELVEEIDQLGFRPDLEAKLILRLRQLLYLKPGWEEYKDLLQQLTVDEEDAAYEESFTFPEFEGDFDVPREAGEDFLNLPPLFLKVAIVTTIVFGGFMIWLYLALSDDRLPIDIVLDTPEAYVVFDGEMGPRAANGGTLHLTPGHHKYEVHNEEEKILGPLSFEVEADGLKKLTKVKIAR